jgi:hypothetical protein
MGALCFQANETSPGSSSKPNRPPPFPKRKKRKRSKAGRKKRQGFGRQVGSNKRDSDTADDAGDSSEFTDSEGVSEVKEESISARGLRSAAAGCSGTGDSVLGKHPLSNKRVELTPAVKRQQIQSVPDFKSEPGLLSPAIAPPPVSVDRPKKKKRIPFTLVEASKGNRCPTEGCEGLGHITGLYAMHFAVSGCPMARGKTAEECRARREELNRLLSKNVSNEGEESEGGGMVSGERSLRRTQRSTVDALMSRRGRSMSLSTRKTHAQVIVSRKGVWLY